MQKPSFKKLQQYLSWKRWMFFWYRYYKLMFFVGFLLVLGLGGYFWYSNLYQYRWSDQRKAEFIEKNFKATIFKEKAFHELVANLKERMRRHEKAVPLSRDIFSGRSL